MNEFIRRWTAVSLGIAGTLASMGALSGQETGSFGSPRGSSQVFVIEDVGYSEQAGDDDQGSLAEEWQVALLYPSPDPTRFPVHGRYLPEPAISAPRATTSKPVALTTSATTSNVNVRPTSVASSRGVTYRINVGTQQPTRTTSTTSTRTTSTKTTSTPAVTTRTTASTGNRVIYVPEDYGSVPRPGTSTGGRTVVTVEDFAGSKGGDTTSSGFVCDACPVVFVPEDWGSKSPPTPTVNEHCPTYDVYGYDEEGFNREGYSKKGYDRAGYDREGYSKAGYDRAGYDRDGYSKAGYDGEGYDRDGYNKAGKDRNGDSRA